VSMLGFKVRTGKNDKRYVPHIYVTNEPPVTINVDGKNIACKEVYPYGSYLLCVQYDGSTRIIQAPEKQQTSMQQG